MWYVLVPNNNKYYPNAFSNVKLYYSAHIILHFKTKNITE